MPAVSEHRVDVAEVAEEVVDQEDEGSLLVSLEVEKMEAELQQRVVNHQMEYQGNCLPKGAAIGKGLCSNKKLAFEKIKYLAGGTVTVNQE